MANEFSREGTKESLALVSGFAQFGEAFSMAHGFDFRENWERRGQRERGMLRASRNRKPAKLGASVCRNTREGRARGQWICCRKSEGWNWHRGCGGLKTLFRYGECGIAEVGR